MAFTQFRRLSPFAWPHPSFTGQDLKRPLDYLDRSLTGLRHLGADKDSAELSFFIGSWRA